MNAATDERLAQLIAKWEKTATLCDGCPDERDAYRECMDDLEQVMRGDTYERTAQ